ncbi:uncharacterized protein CLUP02_12605 [Colletotrichum lupini]|uniref:Uncharacterized protein n=1 Tax=Colletotrichum lupini TaxID=145971 RepID=A0A9Q8T0T2_9PEZI|nr:uncharacterized protein CLUP02_12605 [Colletotrichum lupini]UQC87103.1 hypothetical protein CLUP02_12605 [Colletotrichum lupini]
MAPRSQQFAQLHQEESKNPHGWMQAGNPQPIRPPPGQIHIRNPYVRILAFDPPVKPTIPLSFLAPHDRLAAKAPLFPRLAVGGSGVKSESDPHRSRGISKGGYLSHPSDYNTQYNNLSLFHVNYCTTPPSTSAALSLRHKISEQRIRFDATKKKRILGEMQTATAVSSLPGGAPLSSAIAMHMAHLSYAILPIAG